MRMYVVHRNDRIFMVTKDENLAIKECLNKEQYFKELLGYHVPVTISSVEMAKELRSKQKNSLMC